MSISTSFANYSPCWWTPPEWMDWVTATLGQGWFDPCPRDWEPGDPSGLLDLSWPYDRGVYCNHPGSRRSTVEWWAKFVSELGLDEPGIWCAFNCEQERHMCPSPWSIPGWFVRPRERLGFIWGGPDIITNEKAVAKGEAPKWRRHGSRCESPGNWTVFWSSAKPAPTPSPCVIVRTGFGEAEVEEARRWARYWKRKAPA